MIKIHGWLKVYAWLSIILGTLWCAHLAAQGGVDVVETFSFLWSLVQIASAIVLIRSPKNGIHLNRLVLWVSVLGGCAEWLFTAGPSIGQLIIESLFLLAFYDSDQVKGILLSEGKDN